MKCRTLLTVALISGVLLGGCSSKSRQVNNPDNVQWFCQSNETGEGWECVQDELLAQIPVPTRMPPPPDTQQLEFSEELDPLGLDDQAAVLLDPAATTAVGLGREQGAQEFTAADAAQSDSATQIPLYVQLAYVPPEPTSIMNLPPDYFAVQVLAMPSREQLEDFVISNGISGMSAARVEADGALQYVLLLGIYTTQERALQAISALPAPLSETQARARPLGDLQQAISRADQLVAANPAAVDS